MTTYKTSTLAFPATTQLLGIHPFDLVTIIESFVRADAEAPREIQRHFHAVEEKRSNVWPGARDRVCLSSYERFTRAVRRRRWMTTRTATAPVRRRLMLPREYRRRARRLRRRRRRRRRGAPRDVRTRRRACHSVTHPCVAHRRARSRRFHRLSADQRRRDVDRRRRRDFRQFRPVRTTSSVHPDVICARSRRCAYSSAR